MANIFNKLLETFKLTEDDEDESYDDYVNELEEKERRRAEKLEQKQLVRQDKKSFAAAKSFEREEKIGNFSNLNSASMNTSSNDLKKERVQRVEKSTNVSKVVPIRNAQKGLEVCIMKPTSFEDSQDICDMLLSGRAAVINLEGFDVEVAQRVMDFVSGAVYAMNGKLHQISSYIFIISPDNVDISGDYLDLIRQNGFEVPTLNKDF